MGDGEEELPPAVRQEFQASGTAQQAVLGYGIQNIYLIRRERSPEPMVSIAPPFGQHNEDTPLRGREALLADVIGPGPRTCVLHGLGGCGKTRLALEIAFNEHQSGTEVWWISAADSGVLIVAMRALGRRLGVSDSELEHGDIADLIWQRLVDKREPWLLVIDNADDVGILAGPGNNVAEGQGWLRPMTGKTGMVLVTSRDGSVKSWGSWSRRYQLEMLPVDPASAVLTDYSGRHPSLGTEEDAQLLASRLGGLPLALKIAGSYLAESVVIPAAFTDTNVIHTYLEYCDALQDGDLATVFPAPDGQLTDEQARGLVGRTWELTLELLDTRSLPEARIVLRLLASLAAAPIPLETLIHPPTLAASQPLRGITGARLWQALTALNDFGLVDLDVSGDGQSETRIARLHPLVRDTSSPLGGPERMVYLELAVNMLKRVINDDVIGTPEDPSAWPEWQLLAPHITSVLANLTTELDCPVDTFEVAALAANLAARFKAAQGFHAEAETDYSNILAVRVRMQGPDHSDTLSTRDMLAVEMAGRGALVEAEDEFQKILDARLRVQEPDHLEVLVSRHRLAAAKAVRGAYAEAEADFREILAARLRVQDPDDADVLTTRHEIAAAMSGRGAHAEAEAEYRDILRARIRTLGPNHPFTIAVRHQIAMEIAEQGNDAEALAEFRKVLARILRFQDPDHPDTLFTRYCIAQQMASTGKRNQAEAEFRDILAAQLRVLGPDHPQTLDTRGGIAEIMLRQGRRTEAEAEFQDILAVRMRVQGPDHPDTQIFSELISILKQRKTLPSVF